MTRERKTHLCILALVPLVVFGVVRCADSPAAPDRQAAAKSVLPQVAARLARLHAKYDSAGPIHNAALAYVLADLQRIPKNRRSRNNICETARRSFAEFHRNRFGSELPAGSEAEMVKSCLSAGGPAAPLASLSFGGQPPHFDISQTAVDYMDQVAEAVDISASPADLDAHVSEIEAGAAANLSEEEAAAVVTVGAVTTSSAQYWAENLTAWLPFASSSDTTVAEYSRLTLSNGSRSVGDPASLKPRHSAFTDAWDSIWPQVAAAGKRAIRSDARAAAKTVVVLAVGGVAIGWEVVVTGAATGSILALLMI